MGGFGYNFRKGLWGKCVACNGNGISDVSEDFGDIENSRVTGISECFDLLISDSNEFVEFLDE